MLLKLLWIKHQLEDYDIFESSIALLSDNTTAINFSKNPIFHSCAKYIEMKHHFIRDYLADIFTKPLLEDKLVYIRNLL
ncbi:Copia protein, partial [Mucuna pruriens]